MLCDEEDLADIIAAVQTGDIDVLVDVVRRNLIDVNAMDKDGCSLLHWAAINNRYEICEYLIENGAKVNIAGGLLQELPLAWAVRKQFYSICRLLLIHNSDVNHYSKSRMTVLHLALKSGDLDLVFMLLHYGANPNAVDKKGDSICIWLYKNKIHPELYLKYMQLLINYNCNVINPSNSDDNSSASPMTSEIPPVRNTLLHLLSYSFTSECSDIHEYTKLISIICESDMKGVDSIFEIKNEYGYSAYEIAWIEHNAQLLKLYADLWLYYHTPNWLPVTTSATAVVWLFYWMRHFGIFNVYFFLMCVLDVIFVVILTQASLVTRLGRAYFGASIGLLLTYFITYLVYVEPWLVVGSTDNLEHTSIFRTTATVCLILVLFSMVVIHRSVSSSVQNTSHVGTICGHVRSNRAVNYNVSIDIEQHLVPDSSKVGGTDSSGIASNGFHHECSSDSVIDEMLLSKTNSGRLSKAATSLGSPNKKKHLKTLSPMHRSLSNGSIASIGSNSNLDFESQECLLSGSSPVKKFELCTVCLVNTEHATMHCSDCNKCVLASDHHCSYLGNCITKGNRRLYCWFLLFACITGVLFTVTSFMVQYNALKNQNPSSIVSVISTGAEVVENAKSTIVNEMDAINFYKVCHINSTSVSWINMFSMVQGCVWEKYESLFLLTWLGVSLTIYFIWALYKQMLYIAQGTTTIEARNTDFVSSGCHMGHRKWCSDIWKFCVTGHYVIETQTQTSTSDRI